MRIFQHFLILVLLFITSHANNKHVKLPLFGNASMSYYYTEFYVGNPPKLQTLLVDTGSGLTIIPCSSCLACSSDRFAPLYNFEESFTSSKLRCSNRAPICSRGCSSKSEYCEFTTRYLDQSEATGTIISDQIRFSKTTQHAELLDVFTASFGCINIEKHTGFIQSNGILGLSPSPNQNILYKWFQQDEQRGFEFTFCLGTNGGFLELGHGPEYEEQNQSPDFQISYISNSHFFLIKDLQKIQFGSSNLLNDSAIKYQGGVALDTGSTMTLLPLHEYLMFNSQLVNRCSVAKRVCSFLSEAHTFRGCFVVKFMGRQGQTSDFEAQLDKLFPAFELIIKGKSFIWRASEYFEVTGEGASGTLVCITIRTVDKPIYILGMNWLRNRKFIVNIKQQKIKIFNNYNCTYTDLHQNGEISLWSQVKIMVSQIDTFYVFIGLLILFVIVLSFKENIIRAYQRAKGCIEEYIRFRRERKLQEESVSQDVEMQSEISQPSNISIDQSQQRRRPNNRSNLSHQRRRRPQRRVNPR